MKKFLSVIFAIMMTFSALSTVVVADSYNIEGLDFNGNPYIKAVVNGAYEFDDYDNWNVIEEFAKAVSGNETIWFATNIEICKYVEAYKRLGYFADGKTVYNPTLIDLWMEDEGVTYKIPSGETVKI